jgi:hypothetical protein
LSCILHKPKLAVACQVASRATSSGSGPFHVCSFPGRQRGAVPGAGAQSDHHLNCEGCACRRPCRPVCCYGHPKKSCSRAHVSWQSCFAQVNAALYACCVAPAKSAAV